MPPKRGETTLTFSRTGGKTRISITAYDDRCRPWARLEPEFTQAEVRAIVMDLCQQAGLPKPW